MMFTVFLVLCGYCYGYISGYKDAEKVPVCKPPGTPS